MNIDWLSLSHTGLPWPIGFISQDFYEVKRNMEAHIHLYRAWLSDRSPTIHSKQPPHQHQDSFLPHHYLPATPPLSIVGLFLRFWFRSGLSIPHTPTWWNGPTWSHTRRSGERRAERFWAGCGWGVQGRSPFILCRACEASPKHAAVFTMEEVTVLATSQWWPPGLSSARA